MSEDQQESPSKSTATAEDFELPDGVTVPESIESSRDSLFTGDVVDMLNKLSVEKINEAFETFDYQCNQRGDEIRNKRAYLRGILKGLTGARLGLPNGVQIPQTITKDILEEKDLMKILKTMSVRDINSCFRDYDVQVKKREDQIRNKSAYLLGIIKSGPHYNLPKDAIVPSSISLSMLQGELLETLQKMPAEQINKAFSDYDEQMQKRADEIRNKEGYLAAIVKRVKAEHKDDDNAATEETGSPKNQDKNGSSPAKSPSAAAAGGGETLNNITESFVKVTNELVIERQARNTLQDQMKEEQNKREETNQRILKLMGELAVEKEQRERSAVEVERLRKDLAFERSLRENAEEKVQTLEEDRGSSLEKRAGSEHEQVKRLELDLSIERGLREKTEKLLQAAETRIAELNREVKDAQDKLHEERTKSPFGTWLASMPTNGEDKKEPSLSDLVSMMEKKG